VCTFHLLHLNVLLIHTIILFKYYWPVRVFFFFSFATGL